MEETIIMVKEIICIIVYEGIDLIQQECYHSVDKISTEWVVNQRVELYFVWTCWYRSAGVVF